MEASTIHPNRIVLESPDEIAEAVRAASAAAIPLVDYGLAHEGLGHAPPEPHTRYTVGGEAIEHYVGDMTLRASAGRTIGDIQAALAQEGQFLPLDADDDLALDEVVLHNVYGPMRLGYGASRDLLLGLKYIDHQGDDIHVGGRTVKNVAGYDVTRLMVGSLGQLGIIYEVVTRTYAIPVQVLTVTLAVEDPAILRQATTALLISDAAPAAMQLTYDQKVDPLWRLELGYFGWPNGNAAQAAALEREVGRLDGVTIANRAEGTLADYQAAQAQARAWRRSARAVVHVVIPPATTGEVAKALVNWADEHEAALHLQALPSHGSIFIGGDLDGQAAQSLDHAINGLIKQHGGLRTWHRRPAGAAQAIAPFAPEQPDWPLLQRLKRTFDPDNLFNPGRFL